MELMADKGNRTPFEPGIAGPAMDRIGRKNGLILRVSGDRLAFAPPLIMTEENVDDMADRLGRTLDQAHTEITKS